MSQTCEWTKVESGEYVARHHNLQLRVSRRKGKSGYDTYVGGHYAGTAAAVNAGKTKTIKLAELSAGRDEALRRLIEHPHARKIVYPTVEEAARFDGIARPATPVVDPLIEAEVKFAIEGTFNLSKAVDFRRVVQGLREAGADVAVVTEIHGKLDI